MNDLFPKQVVGRTQETSPGLADRWRAWVNDPVNRASLIQTGLAMLQPLSPGQSVIGHIGQGIGSGLALRGRYEKQQSELRDAEMKRDLEAQKMELQTQELEQRKKDSASDAEYRKGMLGVQQEQNAIARERARQSGMTLSQILAQKQREYRNNESNADQKAAWFQKQLENAAIFGEETTPEWWTKKEAEYAEIQKFARGNASPMAGAEASSVSGAAASQPVTEEDILFTAKKHGITPEEVRRRLGL